MNKAIRKRLYSLLEQIDAAVRAIEEIKDGEDEKLTNQPESIQEGQKGEGWQEIIDALDGFVEDVDTASEDLRNTEGINI